MTQIEINLCSSFLHDHYGEVIQSVGTLLLKDFEKLTVPAICKRLKLSPEQVKPALQVLVSQNLAEFDYNNRGAPTFTLRCHNVLPLIFVPRSIEYVRKRFGEVAELVFEEMCVALVSTFSDMMLNISKEHYESTKTFYTTEELAEFKDVFDVLVMNRLVRRCAKPTIAKSERQEIRVPNIMEGQIILGSLQTSIEHSILAEKGGNAANQVMKANDKNNIFWTPDLQNSFVCLRNEAVIDISKSVINEKAANVITTIFEICGDYPATYENLWNPTTVPTPFIDILGHMRLKHSMNEKELRSYITVLSEVGEYCFLAKVEDRCGGTYTINVKKIIDKLTEEVTAKLVLEKFGSNSNRIYRLILKQKHIEQKHLEEMAMLSPKDAKFCTYTLMQENFIQFLAIPKTTDYAANRMIYLFHVDLNAVCRKVLQLTYKTMMNVMVFSNCFMKKYTRLLNKKTKVEEVIAELEESGAEKQQIDEVYQFLTPPERNTIKTVEKSREEMGAGHCQCIDVIVILYSYTKFPTLRV